jgi:hypothetical protein
MLDTSNAIRTAYLSKLDGFLTLGGRNVEVYGDEPFETPGEQYVILSSISESQVQINNSKFISEVEVDIDIFVEQYMRNDNSQVDDISNQILNLLIPSMPMNDIGDANFEIYVLERTGSRYLPLQSGQNFVARKIITLRNIVKQK